MLKQDFSESRSLKLFEIVLRKLLGTIFTKHLLLNVKMLKVRVYV